MLCRKFIHEGWPLSAIRASTSLELKLHEFAFVPVRPQDEGGLVVKAIDEIVKQQQRALNSDDDDLADVNSGNKVSAETKKAKASAETSANTEDADCINFESDYPTEENGERVSAETPIDVPDDEDSREWTQKKADAFCAMAEYFVSGGAGNGEKHEMQGLAGHERCQVVLHMDVETLKHEHHSASCGCVDAKGGDLGHVDPLLTQHNMDGAWISPANAKRLSCDASMLTVLQDKDGNVLNVGRKTRTVPPHIARALDIRDETCRFVGCTCSNYVDFHHIQHWAEGGE